MTTLEQNPQSTLREAGYPDLLRMGHRFVTSIGQRLIIDGFYGAMDFAFGGDGWFYVLNRYDSNPAYPKLRFAVCNLDDEFPRNVDPHINGESMKGSEEQWDSAVFCDSDRQGNLFFTDERKNQVVTITTDEGDVTGAWGVFGSESGQLNGASGITYLPDDTFWVVSSRSSLVQQFTRDGEYIRGFGEVGSEPGQLSYPWGVTVDPIDGSIVVADWRNDRIQRFTPEGELLQVVDELGRDAGRLNRPSDVAIDKHGDLYVCDRGNDRLVQFNRAGLFIEAMRGDAVMTERGADKLMANPDMLRWRDHIIDLGREKLFWKPTAVKVDDDCNVYVIDSGRFRMQVYQKTFRELEPGQLDAPETYADPKIN
jgi:sugar lactone lactonase YvrE